MDQYNKILISFHFSVQFHFNLNNAYVSHMLVPCTVNETINTDP
jgi:hypothetical protein